MDEWDFAFEFNPTLEKLQVEEAYWKMHGLVDQSQNALALIYARELSNLQKVLRDAQSPCPSYLEDLITDFHHLFTTSITYGVPYNSEALWDLENSLEHPINFSSLVVNAYQLNDFILYTIESNVTGAHFDNGARPWVLMLHNPTVVLWCIWCLQEYKSDIMDYIAYETHQNHFLRGPHGHSALLYRGIMWRITVQVLKLGIVLLGPSKYIFQTRDAVVLGPVHAPLWDDALSKDELDLICGIYKVDMAPTPSTSAVPALNSVQVNETVTPLSITHLEPSEPPSRYPPPSPSTSAAPAQNFIHDNDTVALLHVIDPEPSEFSSQYPPLLPSTSAVPALNSIHGDETITLPFPISQFPLSPLSLVLSIIDSFFPPSLDSFYLPSTKGKAPLPPISTKLKHSSAYPKDLDVDFCI
ncbi:hypothetical protein EW146_g8202 [Bondarzewia mesenterica]|uniref:Uncharacterized protein n=1 Tax=Bondarzewia mesenterica TaxID=1095465 RepID=A0A4S4LGZ5_9AGAM|nr:hypothetical protein EW146_g8202 [Bondarzewia mesenterica]